MSQGLDLRVACLAKLCGIISGNQALMSVFSASAMLRPLRQSFHRSRFPVPARLFKGQEPRPAPLAAPCTSGPFDLF